MWGQGAGTATQRPGLLSLGEDESMKWRPLVYLIGAVMILVLIASVAQIARVLI
jgi:hypothetical protein